MKKVVNLLVVLALVCVSCNKSDTNAEQGSGVQTTPTPVKVVEVDFFLKNLEGSTGEFQQQSPLKLSEVAQAQKEVWQNWKQANEQFKEEKLIGLQKLDSDRQHRWVLPHNLEPRAIMKYYYGYFGQKPTQGFPLYLYMHGSGDPDSEWAAGVGIAASHPEVAGVYFVPRIPNTGEYYRWYHKSKQFAWERLIRLAHLSGDIDVNKIFFYGVSEGGYGSQRLASYYADYLAGAGPMAGGEPLINSPVENCRNLAFFFLTGERDEMFHRNRLTRYTKEEFEKFHTQDPSGWTHNIVLEEGKGHGVTYAKAVEWLKDFRRNPYPKKVVWEDFEMHGNYRKGFHNLVVKKRFGNNRYRYTMDIVGNQINLNIDEVTYQSVEQSDARHGNFTTKYTKTHTPAAKASVVVYLNEQLVNLNQEVVVVANGKEVFRGKPELDKKHLVNSCAIFFDAQRLYPAAIEVSF